MKKVLIPVDGSEFSLEGIRLFKDLNICSSNELHLLNVQNIAFPYETYHSLGSKDNVMDYLREQGEKVINQAAKILQGEKYHTAIRIGDTITEILDYADEIGAELIIVGSHGKSGLTSVIMGSVTSKLLSYSEIPVLVTRIKNKPSK
ncbi:MAG: universal stress protein [Eubacteriales bacterium]|nr:universal stress protein [Eubacteriales bacterium]NCC81914.1 universal stress protein [Clostridia bacterium]